MNSRSSLAELLEAFLPLKNAQMATLGQGSSNYQNPSWTPKDPDRAAEAPNPLVFVEVAAEARKPSQEAEVAIAFAAMAASESTVVADSFDRTAKCLPKTLPKWLVSTDRPFSEPQVPLEVQLWAPDESPHQAEMAGPDP